MFCGLLSGILQSYFVYKETGKYICDIFNFKFYFTFAVRRGILTFTRFARKSNLVRRFSQVLRRRLCWMAGCDSSYDQRFFLSCLLSYWMLGWVCVVSIAADYS